MAGFFRRMFALDSAYSIADKAWAVLFWLFPAAGAAVTGWLASELQWYWATTGWAGVAAAAIVAFFLLSIGLAAITWVAERWRPRRQRGVEACPDTISIAAPPAKAELRFSANGGDFSTPNGRHGTTLMAISAAIWNTGAPSIAVDWSLYVYPAGGLPVRGLAVMVDDYRAGGEQRGVVIRQSDLLIEKTRLIPISGAIPIPGLLVFVVGLSKEIVEADTTRLELSVKDNRGQETRQSIVMRDWKLPEPQQRVGSIK